MERADPEPVSPKDQSAKYKNRIKNLEEAQQSLYEKLDERDQTIIPQLEYKVTILEAANADLRKENASLRDESSRFEATLAAEKQRFETEKDAHERAKEALRSSQQRCKIEEGRANSNASRYEDLWGKYKELELEFDKCKATALVLHGQYDKVEDERDTARRDAEMNQYAAQRLQEIEDTFDPIFQELGVQLTPQNLIERFTVMYNKSLLRQDDYEQSIESQMRRRPNLNERKVSVASIGDELSGLESDGESEDNSLIAGSHDSESQGNTDTRRDSQTEGQSGKNPYDQPEQTIAEELEPSHGLEEELGESWSAVDGGSPIDANRFRRPSNRQDDAPPSVVVPREHQVSDHAFAEAETSQEPPGADDEALGAGKHSNGLLKSLPVLESVTQQNREVVLQAELVSKEKQIRDLLHQLNSQPKPPRAGKPITKYVSIVREATFAEHLERAPWWAKVILIFMVILWAALTTSAWRERNLWLAANDTTFLYGRRLQANSNQCHWAIVEWFENYIGLDKRLLG